MNKYLMVVVAMGFARNLTIEIQTTEYFMNTSILFIFFHYAVTLRVKYPNCFTRKPYLKEKTISYLHNY